MEAYLLNILLVIAIFFTHLTFSKSHVRSIINPGIAFIAWIFFGLAATNITYRWGGDFNVITYTASETILQYPFWMFVGFIGVLILVNFIVWTIGGEFTKKSEYTGDPPTSVGAKGW